MREVLIDLNALKSNLQKIKKHAGVPVLAVVKADAYGHGLIPCAKAAVEAGADFLGVALLEEAILLREAGWLLLIRRRQGNQHQPLLQLWHKESIRVHMHPL